MENPMDDMNFQPEDGAATEQTATESYAAPPRPSRRGLYTVIAVIVLLTAAAMIVRGNWLRIRYIEVTGLVNYLPEQVIAQAGIGENTTYFNLSEDRIRRNIEEDRYLHFEGMEKKWPDSLTLHIRERRRQANVLFMGIQYVISQDGMVLESSSKIELHNGCVKVTGLNLRDIRFAAPLVCQDETQLETLGLLFDELDIQGFTDEVAELNLSSLESIYIVTLDGFTANIGSAEELRAKIGTVRAVVRELRNREKKGGMIEATVPGQASYRPVQ